MFNKRNSDQVILRTWIEDIIHNFSHVTLFDEMKSISKTLLTDKQFIATIRLNLIKVKLF